MPDIRKSLADQGADIKNRHARRFRRISCATSRPAGGAVVKQAGHQAGMRGHLEIFGRPKQLTLFS